MSAQVPLYPRYANDRITIALADTPVVMVNGPRQCGKTTLVRGLENGGRRRYITLDDETVLASARADPAGFIRELDVATIDEVQRAPDLLRAIKRSVDDDRRPGRFLLTGSANILAMPTIAESLAGRMEVVTLLPLSQAEIRGRKADFIEDAFAGKVRQPAHSTLGKELIDAVITGGYPEVLARRDSRRRAAWAREYIRAIIERDVRDIIEVDKLEQMPQLLRALASHASQLTNFSQLGGQLRLDDKTVRRYIGILEHVFLVRRIEPWFRNDLKRIVKTPKLHFLDTGLLSVLLGANSERVTADRSQFGSILESFVISEILKITSWSGEEVRLSHYRDKDQDEVDLVMENEVGSLVAVEVKASATVSIADFKGLRKVAQAAGSNFRLGLVLYDGETVLPFGEGLFAAPLSCLWN
jgi:predicted AAA+ superfamily ATPase